MYHTLRDWDCWDETWEVPTSGGITQARQRLGYEPLRKLFSQVAAPVTEELTRGAFLGPWRLMAIDGFGWDAPATKANMTARPPLSWSTSARSPSQRDR